MRPSRPPTPLPRSVRLRRVRRCPPPKTRSVPGSMMSFVSSRCVLWPARRRDCTWAGRVSSWGRTARANRLRSSCLPRCFHRRPGPRVSPATTSYEKGRRFRRAAGGGAEPLLSGREHLFLQAALHSLPLSEELADLCLRRPSQTPSWRESRDYQPIQAPPADPEPMCPLHSRPILRTLGPCR